MNANNKGPRVWTSMTPYQVSTLDRLAGTIYGSTRAEVVRTILISWLHTNAAAVQHAMEEYETWKRSHPDNRKGVGSGK